MGSPPDEEDEQEETRPCNNSENEQTHLTLPPTQQAHNQSERSRTLSLNIEISQADQTVTSIQERRSSLPPGVIENGHISSLCGQILRVIGDEQYSMATGRHLRCMGDQLCYSYFVRNMLRRSAEFQRPTSSMTGSHSSPNLSQHKNKK